MTDGYESHNFNVAMAFIRKWEGGYVWDKDDPGGETKFGISKRSYPGEDIKNLSRERAEALYKRDYWDKLDLDKYPQDKAVVLMNVAVNMGVGKAREFAKSGDYRKAIQSIRDHYAAIIAKNPKLGKYRRGWENRTKDLESYLSIK